MESPQKKAGSAMVAETRPLLLPASVAAAKKTLLAARPEAVRAAVSAWALFTPCAFLLSFTVETALCGQCRPLTDALEVWMLCCVVLQAAAAVLALWLPCHRRWVGRALAYLALALTIGGHCIYAASARLKLVAEPGNLFFKIAFAVVIVIFAAGDIIGFLALLGLRSTGAGQAVLRYTLPISSAHEVLMAD